MKEIIDYLATLDKPDLHFAVSRMSLGKNRDRTAGGCCGQQPIGPPPTPNGDWECGTDCKWVWIPDIG